jgi:hypothetical protein
MRTTLTAAIFTATVLGSTAAHASNEQFRVDLATCQERADIMATARPSSVTTSAINTGANVLSALIAGRDPSNHIANGARAGINRTAQDARNAEMRREQEIRTCMRQIEAERKRGK